MSGDTMGLTVGKMLQWLHVYPMWFAPVSDGPCVVWHPYQEPFWGIWIIAGAALGVLLSYHYIKEYKRGDRR